MNHSTTLFTQRMRWGLLLAVILLAMPIALACGDGDDEDDPTATPGSGGASPTAGSGGTTPAGGGGLTVVAGDVDVLGIWGGEELDSFDDMMQPYTAAGGKVNFTGTRSITSELTVRVEGGSPPDIAIPAEIGLMQEFARNGDIISLDECTGLEAIVKAKYPDGFQDLATVDGKLYGFFMKADTKATVWYNPKVFDEANVEPLDDDASYEDLVTLTKDLQEAGITPWSIGMEAGDGSGFPGSDWLQQIILNEAGEDVYDGLIDGTTKFTDAKVKDAWTKWGEIVLNDDYSSQGGPEGINATNFQDAVYPPFENDAQAAMVALGGFAAGFITGQFPNAKAGDDFDFFTWPGGAITGGANVVYAFNNDPATCSLMTYLASGDAQERWVKRGGFTSVNEDVSLEAYPNDVARNQAKQLIDADSFRFDLDDAIGGALQQALFRGVTEYLSDPGKLDSILSSIEAARGQPASTP